MVRVVMRGVAGVDVAVGDRYLRPRQGVERGEEPGLVFLDGEHESRAAFVQVFGVGALGVEGVRCDHRPAQVDTGAGELIEQGCEHRDLIGLHTDLDLTEHEAVAVGRGGEQVHLVALGIGGAAHGLALHCDTGQPE